MDTFLLAQIIQGEAGGMGAVGMIAIALSLHCRIWQYNHDMDRIAKEWYGRAEPSRAATVLAELVAAHALVDNDYYFAMGHGPDVEAQGFKRGDWVIMSNDGKVGLHLYKASNVPWEKEDGKGNELE